MANFPHSSTSVHSVVSFIVFTLHTAKNLNKTMQRQKKKKIPTLHLLMVGDSHVGKSCLMNRHCFGSFNHNHVTVSIQIYFSFPLRLSFAFSHSLTHISCSHALFSFAFSYNTHMPFNITFLSHSQTIGIDYKLQRLKLKEIGKENH